MLPDAPDLTTGRLAGRSRGPCGRRPGSGGPAAGGGFAARAGGLLAGPGGHGEPGGVSHLPPAAVLAADARLTRIARL